MISGDIYSQSNGDFRTTGDVNFVDATNWETYNGNSWITVSSSPDLNANIITIKAGHTATLTANKTLDQIVIESGGILQINSEIQLTLNNGSGYELDVSGTIKNSGIINLTGNIIFNNGGVYQHLHTTNNGTIPTATWSSGSTCEIRGFTSNSNLPLGTGQNFYNFVWDCPNQTTNINFAGNFTIVGGNLLINNTGTGSLRLAVNSSPTLTIAGKLQITGGTFDLSSSSGNPNIELSGDLEMTGGTLTETGSGNGTIKFVKSGIQTFTKTGGNISNTINFLVRNGSILNMGTSVFTGSGTFTVASGGTLGIGHPDGISSSGATGNIQVTGTRTFNTSANYLYNGVSGQSIGNGLPSSVNQLEINNPNGITLSGSITVNSNLILTDGKINTTTSNLIYLGNSATFSGGSTSSFVNGPVAKITNSATEFTLPTGKGNTYSPISIIPSDANENIFQAEYFNTAYSNTTSFGTGIASVSQIGYYDLSRISGTTTAKVKMFWDENTGVTSYTNLRIGHWTGSLWENLGGTNITGNNSGGSLETTNYINSFSPFVLASGTEQPLPVKLYSFSCNAISNIVKLNWQTSEEINNSGFEIERKSGNENWGKIGFVKGNNKPSEYIFEDRNLQTGKYQYRLKQIDFNGNYEYFELKDLVEIGAPEKLGLSQNYPNPFNSKTVINWQIPKSAFVSIKIYDICGREVYTLINEHIESGYYSTVFDASNLASGVYYYRMISGNYSKTEKLLLVK